MPKIHTGDVYGRSADLHGALVTDVRRLGTRPTRNEQMMAKEKYRNGLRITYNSVATTAEGAEEKSCG